MSRVETRAEDAERGQMSGEWYERAAMRQTSMTLVRSENLAERVASSRYERHFKRTFDLVFGTLLVVLALPMGLVIALVIRMGLGSGVIYRQTRVGRHGEPFTIWKFRTMRPDRRRSEASPVENDRRQEHKTEHDPRHTGLGRLLRRLSLDELPQLWNVLRGDMSLVGPRPEIYEIAEERGYVNHPRHQVRPGVTGPYQVSPIRMNADLRDGFDLDADYVDSISLWGDVSLLFRTIGVLLGVGSRGT